jgi:hypothetical protein
VTGGKAQSRLPRCAGLPAAIVAISILPTGCAGGAEERLSPKALAAKADVICFHLKQGINSADAHSNNGRTIPDRAKLSVLYAAAEERATNQLAKLKPEASAEREWDRAIAKRRALVPYHHRMTKYASRGEVGKLETTYSAYKVFQWQMELGFKHTRFPFKLCWDIG